MTHRATTATLASVEARGVTNAGTLPASWATAAAARGGGMRDIDGVMDDVIAGVRDGEGDDEKDAATTDTGRVGSRTTAAASASGDE